MQYRIATSDDLDALADLRWTFIQEDGGKVTASISEFRNIFRHWSEQHPNCYHFVAEENGNITSMMSLFITDPLPRPIKNNPAWGYLTNTYTIPTERNKGVASGLLQFVKDWILQRGLETVIVWPSDESMTFYERAGFDGENKILELQTALFSKSR